MREALILAGGRGVRLGELTDETPKPLIDVGGVPFIEHLLWNLERHGIERAVLSVGYLVEKFEEFAASRHSARPRSRLHVEVVAEPEPLGTGGAVAFAATCLKDDVALVLNGDTLFDLNYLDLALAVDDVTPVAIALMGVDDASRYGAVTLDDGHITAFAEKPGREPGLANGGVYAADVAFLTGMGTGRFSLETDVFPQLVSEGRLAGRSYGGTFVDMGTPESLARARETIGSWYERPAVLFDRDGVLNVDHGHVATPERFDWMPGAREAVKAVNDAGMLAIAVTNQAGIAKGLYTQDEYLAFEQWIAECLAEGGAHLDAVYHCPHHPEGSGEYRAVCDCRKPAPGMVLSAIADWGLDTGRTVLLGDKASDLEAARAAGVEGVRFDGGDLRDAVIPLIERLASAR